MEKYRGMVNTVHAIRKSDDTRTCDTGVNPAADGVGGSCVADPNPNGRGNK